MYNICSILLGCCCCCPLVAPSPGCPYQHQQFSSPVSLSVSRHNHNDFWMGSFNCENMRLKNSTNNNFTMPWFSFFCLDFNHFLINFQFSLSWRSWRGYLHRICVLCIASIMFTVSKPDKYFCLLSHIFVSTCVLWLWRCCTVSSSLILDSWMCPTVPVSSVPAVHFPTITLRIFGLYRVFNWLLGMLSDSALSAHLSFINGSGIVPSTLHSCSPAGASCGDKWVNYIQQPQVILTLVWSSADYAWRRKDHKRKGKELE